MENAQESIQFFFERAVSTNDVSDPYTKKQITNEIIPLLKAIKNEVERSHWIQHIARKLKISEMALQNELERYKPLETRDTAPAIQTPQKPVISRRMRIEERIGGLLTLEPKLATSIEYIQPEYIAHAEIQPVIQLLRTSKKYAKTKEILDALDTNIQNTVSRCVMEAELHHPEHESREADIRSLDREWQVLHIKDQLEILRERIQELEAEGDAVKSIKLMEEFQALSNRLAAFMIS